MTYAYSEEYLDDAMKNLGDMVDYAVQICGYEPDLFLGIVYILWDCNTV